MNRPGFATCLAAAGAFAVAGAALAHPHPKGAGPEKKVERVIVLTDHGGAKGGEPAPRIRTLHIDGKGLASCEGGKTLVDESAGDEKEKTKILICGKDGDPAANAKRLEEALARINSNEHLSAEHKEKIGSALREAIDRARSAR